MEIDKASRKETAWKIKLDDEGKILIVNAIEDTTQAEPNATILMADGDNKISVTLAKDKFLNLIGVLDSFSQICLGVEPKLPEEEYAPRTEAKPELKKVAPEIKAQPKPSVKAEAKKVIPVSKPKTEPTSKTREQPAPKSKPVVQIKKPVETSAVTASRVEIKKPVSVKTTVTTPSKAIKSASAPVQKPKSVAFPPRFPQKPADIEDEKIEEQEVEPEKQPKKQTIKPTPPKVSMPVKEQKESEDEESTPEWDPW